MNEIEMTEVTDLFPNFPNQDTPVEMKCGTTSTSKEEVYEKILKYFGGDEMVAKVFQKKYSFNGLETPEDVYMREAKEFALIEYKYELGLTKEKWEKLSKYGKKRHKPYDDSSDGEEWLFKIFGLLYHQRILSGGSVTASLGTKELSSISNCTVIESPHDSLIGLNRTAMEMQLLAKRRAGVGVDLSSIRPKGALVNNQSKISAGVTLWMEKYSNAIKEVAQANRRGALMISLNCTHPDILDFIKAKEDLSKITGANISVKWTNDFFDALERDGDWITSFPNLALIHEEMSILIDNLEYNTYANIDGYDIVKYKAQELWDTFIRLAWTNAEPGAILWDNIHYYNPAAVYEELKAISLNPCGEISLAPNDSCRLIHKNLTKCVKLPIFDKVEVACLDKEKLYELAYENACMGDDIVDMEIEAIDRMLESIDPLYMGVCEGKFYDLKEDIKQYKLFCIEEDKDINEEFILWLKFRDKGLKGRRCGCGFVGWGDIYAMLNVPYGDEKTTEEIMRIVFKAELDAQIDLAIIRGPFPLWDKNKEFYIDGNNTLVPKNIWYRFLRDEFPEETERMIKYGRRNSSWSTVAPTGTKGMIAQTTSGIEPVFQPFYIRRTKCYENESYDFIDKDGQKFKEHVVVHHGLRNWVLQNSKKPVAEYKKLDWDEMYKASPYYKQSAEDLDIETRIKAQGIIQKYITESISSTVNLKKEATIDDVRRCYELAIKHNLKGVTVYRDGSRAGIMVKNVSDDCVEFIERSCPKRPKELPSDFYKFTYKNDTWIVVVGLYCDRPYELFVFKPDLENIELFEPNFKKIKNHRGVITKIKKGAYEFRSEFIYIPDLDKYNSQEEKRHVYRTSLELRHGVPIRYLISTIKRFDENVTSFSSIIGRILSKYLSSFESNELCPDCGGKVINEVGCLHCIDCAWSRCEG